MTESILIVDDSTFIVEGLAALLKKRYKPISSFSGQDCLDILRTTTPSLIILDIMMEPMDGWETLARIKADPKTRHIPVLMFSAKKISPMEAEAHRIIIDDFITKPVNPKKLIEAIEKVLTRQEFNRQVVGTWTAAGVSPEVIDEYLTLKMNLDVDISLLAVMQKQLEMAYTDSVNREELIESIAALGDRIASTKLRIGSFCRDRQGDLPVVETESSRQDAEDRGCNAEPEVVGAGPEVVEPPHGAAAGIPPEYEEHDTAPVMPEPAAEPEKADEPTASPDQAMDSGPVAAGPGQPVPDTAPAFSVSFPVIAPAGEPKPDPVPQPEAKYDADGSGDMPTHESHGSGATRIIPEQVTVVSGTPETNEPEPLFEPFETGAREPLVRQYGSGDSKARVSPGVSVPVHDALTDPVSSAVPGSGTDTPRMRSLEATSRIERAEKRESEYAPRRDPEGSGGFLSRIISAITSVFRR